MTEDKNTKIVSDEDWKQQAQREKEKLSQQEKTPDKTAPDEPAGDHEHNHEHDHAHTHTLPEAGIATLVESLTIQTLYAMGKIQDPSGSQPTVNLDLAKHHIDTLQVIQDKTRNNLTEEETKLLAIRLHELRLQYVSLAQ